MKPNSVRLALVILASVTCIIEAAAQDDAKKRPPDGIYYIHNKGDGFKMVRNDTGEAVYIGEKITGNLGMPRFYPHVNDNSHVGIVFNGAGPFPVGERKGRFAILIGGYCLQGLRVSNLV